MEKIKSMLKGESSDKSSSTGDNARDAASTAKDQYSTSGSTGQNTSGISTGGSSSSEVPESYSTQTQHIAPAVQKETVTRAHEDKVQHVIDKDIHQDHHHTTVQPLTDREVQPTVHKQQTAPTQYSEFEHGDAGKTEAALKAQAAQFKDTMTDGGISKTSSTMAPVQGESVHHHMHETIQPVVHKETVQPTVTHTTIPIKEVHHGAAKIHETTVAPPMSVDEFSKMSSEKGSGSGN